MFEHLGEETRTKTVPPPLSSQYVSLLPKPSCQVLTDAFVRPGNPTSHVGTLPGMGWSWVIADFSLCFQCTQNTASTISIQMNALGLLWRESVLGYSEPSSSSQPI